MASSSDGKSRGSGHGVNIDTTLIHKASSDVQSELSVLGVSVYNQEEFEAGVLHQIDKEVNRQNAEQKRKFLLKEYRSVKTEINCVRLELNTISKTIAGLLSQPLSNVVLRLRDLRASQEVKRKQLQSLEAREQHILRKVSGNNAEDEQDERQSQSNEPASDVAFSLPPLSTDDGSLSEQQKLIQSGHLTPFGSRVDEGTSTQAQSDVTVSDSNVASMMSVEVPGPSSSGGVQPTLMKLDVQESQTREEKPTPAIQLCSDSFDGLFFDPSASLESIVSKKKRKSRAASESRSISSSLQGDVASSSVSVSESKSSGDAFEASVRSEEFGLDGWMPSISDLEASDSEHFSTESEYITDEELGETSIVKKKVKKKKKLRDLSSDELEFDKGEESRSSSQRGKKRKGSGKKRKGRREPKKFQDDGDDELFRLRMLQHKEDQDSEDVEPNIQFDGGFQIPGTIWHCLYRYQQTGVKWLWELHCQQAGGIVGDEMGLGKTIQVIAFLAGLQISNLRSHITRKLGLGPVLIVCPATVMHQWVSEFHKWWPAFRVSLLHDTGTYSGDKRTLISRNSGVVITTYAGVRIYQDALLSQKWDYVILDEGHKIRNPDSEVTLACKQFTTPHRLILSGSPMQNNLRELWSLFDFVFPGKLGTLPVFMEEFSVPITIGGYANATEVQVQTAYRCASVLRDTINPYLLRRMKADVKIQLPNKNEQVLFCRLTEYQVELYRDFIQSPTVEAMLTRRMQVFSALMTLRKLCNHPDLVTNDYSELVTSKGVKKGSSRATATATTSAAVSVGKEARKKEDKEEEEKEEAFMVIPTSKGRGKNKAVLSVVDNEETYGHWRRSGKMVVIESLLRLWKDQGHRVLLFSQTKLMLDILERFVVGQGYTYRRMDGGTPISTRQPLINHFNEDASIFVFLLTTRVGGLGVNLTGANRVVIYDPDWNPSTDTQARERAWRIGQTRQVTIYRLLTSGTIEEKIYHRQIFKQFLTNRVLKDPRQRRFFKSNTLFELFTLGSSSSEGSTETSAIFAGTGSEVAPRMSSSSSSRKRKGRGSASAGVVEEPKEKKKKHKRRKTTHNVGVLDTANDVAVTDETEDTTTAAAGLVPSLEASSSLQTMNSEPCTSSSSSHQTDAVLTGIGAGLRDKVKSRSSLVDVKGKTELREIRKRKKRKKKHKVAKVDDMEIEGLEHTTVFEPGEGDEEDSKEDDYILKKLFKKSGVHSAMQHDTIMNSADPDYVLVESEAKKVAQSAVRALKVSRRRCRELGGGWGRPTWTGQRGLAGAPGAPRFGSGSKILEKQSSSSSTPQEHFKGQVAGSSSKTSSSQAGSLNTSSSHLLAKMLSRNAHTYSNNGDMYGNGVVDIHHREHGELLKEIRDFIATQCRVDGQATTAEILERFANRLPRSDTATFRSMLHEICDFSRHLGEGLWFLKSEFR